MDERSQAIQARLDKLAQEGKAPRFVEASVLSSKNSPKEMLLMKIEITEDNKCSVRQYVCFLEKKG